MNRIFATFALLVSSLFFAQIDNINNGEKLSYRIHYGILNAGTANLSATQINYKGRPHYRVTGVGKSTGMVRAFFKVDDIYESYIDIATGLPSFYVRNVSEGSYRRHYETTFDHDNQTLVLNNKLDKGTRNFKTMKGIQDMLSSFYYLRSIENSKFKVGNYVKMNIWIDDESYPFMLKVVGVENKKTKFGTIECLKIIPSVMSGRVFKEKEGVTMWVTNDQNHIPVEVEAKLAVGSLKASLSSYSNNKYPMNFK
ncbi:MAG: DUF3108 domain-containing protein [Cloacibacterium sp.]|jgi:hypothetical protein|nr:DUF3108 domain-containing protein [Cloacibacterium sp.]